MGMIRVLLALAVLFTHLPMAPFKVMGGGLAVQCFFIVSGFYMALVLRGKYGDDRTLFYSNRLLRLLPSYFAMMALYALALFGFGISATASTALFAQAFAQPGTALVLALENLGIVGQELLFWFRLDADGFAFDPSGATPTETASVGWQALIVPQSWSLSMELVFYAMAPWLVRLGIKPLVALAAASIALRLGGHWLPVNYGIWQGRLFPTALFLFLLGVLAQRALPWAAKAPLTLRWAITAATMALIVGLPRLGLPDEASRWAMYGWMACALPFVFSAFQHQAVDRWVGELSFPVYLSHLLVVALVLQFEPAWPAAVAIGGTVVVSVLVLLLIDAPLDRWRQVRAQRAANSFN